jgi:hypothetical protein
MGYGGMPRKKKDDIDWDNLDGKRPSCSWWCCSHVAKNRMHRRRVPLPSPESRIERIPPRRLWHERTYCVCAHPGCTVRDVSRVYDHVLCKRSKSSVSGMHRDVFCALDSHNLLTPSPTRKLVPVCWRSHRCWLSLFMHILACFLIYAVFVFDLDPGLCSRRWC